jgi:hypothetical protein
MSVLMNDDGGWEAWHWHRRTVNTFEKLSMRGPAIGRSEDQSLTSRLTG